MRLVKVRQYANAIRVGTDRRMEIRLAEHQYWTALPVPEAGLMLGKGEFEQQSDLIWRTWRAHTAQLR